MLKIKNRTVRLYRDKNLHYRPWSLYLGKQGIAGFHYYEDEGQELVCSHTYNDSCKLYLYGKTIEDGQGVKGHNNPFVISEVNDFNVICTDGKGISSRISFPYKLNSVPGNVSDYIVVDNIEKTTKLIQNVYMFKFNGSEAWYTSLNAAGDKRRFSFTASPSLMLTTDARISSTHFNGANFYEIFLYDNQISMNPTSSTISISARAFDHYTVADFKNWLNEQYVSGMPVTAYCQLAAPIVTNLSHNAVKTYYPNTHIYTDSVISPFLKGLLRVTV